jgi:hypothetical protein
MAAAAAAAPLPKLKCIQCKEMKDQSEFLNQRALYPKRTQLPICLGCKHKRKEGKGVIASIAASSIIFSLASLRMSLLLYSFLFVFAHFLDLLLYCSRRGIHQ